MNFFVSGMRELLLVGGGREGGREGRVGKSYSDERDVLPKEFSLVSERDLVIGILIGSLPASSLLLVENTPRVTVGWPTRSDK